MTDVQGLLAGWEEALEAFPTSGTRGLALRVAGQKVADALRLHEAEKGEHICYIEDDPDTGTPAHYRPCPAALCEATRLLELVRELAEELKQRRACLVGARDDLHLLTGASAEDGGLWTRSVAGARVPLVNAAIEETDRALVVVAAALSPTGRDV